MFVLRFVGFWINLNENIGLFENDFYGVSWFLFFYIIIIVLIILVYMMILLFFLWVFMFVLVVNVSKMFCWLWIVLMIDVCCFVIFVSFLVRVLSFCFFFNLFFGFLLLRFLLLKENFLCRLKMFLLCKVSENYKFFVWFGYIVKIIYIGK